MRGSKDMSVVVKGNDPNMFEIILHISTATHEAQCAVVG